ncbi:MAG: L-arabinose isomerase [Chitinispirillaceae bacterium]|nr:L-arabinose isomerase [Chitinispirillaceae bacterium]
MVSELSKKEIWFVTGSQHLYGPAVLKQVAEDSKTIVAALGKSKEIPVSVVFKPVMKVPDEITGLCVNASASANCIGIITWCHTFSPSKMWINGLKILQKPVLHLHTQFNRDLPWGQIDMDFMNLNQSAHGDREHGFIMTRMRIDRKVVVGHWQDEEVQKRIGVWTRAAAAWDDMQNMKVARFGDNMREVAVTEGDKVEAQIKLGLSVNSYGVGDIVKVINKVTDAEIDKVVKEYDAIYQIDAAGRKGGALHNNVRYQARIEIGIRSFLRKGGFKAFTTTFEDLHGLEQLPGLASQRLMASGYGFGAEGDWKHASMVRALKVMGEGLKGGCSFMEDYTYHLNPKGMKVLGAHMLEICPTIGDGKSKLEVHPLGIGGKDDPARLVFNVPTGPAINVSLIDMGNRFRMIVNAVDCVAPEAPLPKLPVARALWVPQPDLKVGAAAWIYAGGAHHTAFSQAVTAEYIEDFCDMAGIEYVCIDRKTNISDFRKELKWNEMYYMLAKGL